MSQISASDVFFKHRSGLLRHPSLDIFHDQQSRNKFWRNRFESSARVQCVSGKKLTNCINSTARDALRSFMTLSMTVPRFEVRERSSQEISLYYRVGKMFPHQICKSKGPNCIEVQIRANFECINLSTNGGNIFWPPCGR